MKEPMMLQKLTLLAALTAAAAISPADAAEMKISGTMKASVVQQQAVPLGSQDHVLVTDMDKGTTSSPGSPLDGAALLVSQTLVLEKGSGPQVGQVSLANDKGSITNEIKGTFKTIMVDGQPRVSTNGTYRMISGTGMFAGGSGHGTYSVTFTSKNDWIGDYKGVLTVPKMQASR